MGKDETKFNFDKDERVLCYHGPLLYEAKIMKRERRDESDEEEEGPFYLVHYKGWKQTWDEWVPEDRVLKYTDTNLQKRQQLKEMHSRRKPSRTSTSYPSESESRGRKRTRDSSAEKTRMEEEVKRPEFRIPVPETLKGLLVDDWENITKNKQVVRLPCEITVSDILGHYLQSKNHDDERLEQVVQGIKLYFNKSLGTLLLYRSERKQYDEILAMYPNKEPTDLYGAEHLLRLFVELPSLISQSNVDPETLAMLKESFADFISCRNLSDLPVEMLRHIIGYLDTVALFELYRVASLYRVLTWPSLVAHARQIKVRLWIHQSGAVSHKPLDFEFLNENKSGKLVFSFQGRTTTTDNNNAPFPPAPQLGFKLHLPPPQIDGCLLQIPTEKKRYSLAYRPAFPVDLHQELMNARGWQLRYTCFEDPSSQRHQFIPLTIECRMDLLDPRLFASENTVIPPKTTAIDSTNKNEKKKSDRHVLSQMPISSTLPVQPTMAL
ncbi:Esa1p-associated factor [Apophysomyces ossiformis]|uniref:Chromatin modification-related protein EAF3 n=1 Tax=Apophysomyces ossiformis TaxID=679940 RepID=A0A8H7BUS6_9FUNG|nr:Esa1p-associated factor [Apophysomyces ossiformis]KAF7727560.1 Esa1p-associated factor [Apophysomyces ossiformis]